MTDPAALQPHDTVLQRAVNSLGVLAPNVAFLLAVVLGWGHWLTVTDAVVFGVFFLYAGFGVTIGLHRMLTHRSFKCSPAVRNFWALAGAMSMEGPIIQWVATHRKHHNFSDEPGDPHTPHGHGDGAWGALRGLLHAYIGWLLMGQDAAAKDRYAPDLLKDPGVAFIDRHMLLWTVVSLGIAPGLLGLAIGGVGAVGGAVLWGGVLRVVVTHHGSYSVNSICHAFGRRRFETTDKSRNVVWLAPFTLGEAFHHNHHAFPTSAYHGLSRLERLVDFSGLLIAAMARVGLVCDVVCPSVARQRAKLSTAHLQRTVPDAGA